MVTAVLLCLVSCRWRGGFSAHECGREIVCGANRPAFENGGFLAFFHALHVHKKHMFAPLCGAVETAFTAQALPLAREL